MGDNSPLTIIEGGRSLSMRKLGREIAACDVWLWLLELILFGGKLGLGQEVRAELDVQLLQIEPVSALIEACQADAVSYHAFGSLLVVLAYLVNLHSPVALLETQVALHYSEDGQ
jgi:hypothetical protein